MLFLAPHLKPTPSPHVLASVTCPAGDVASGVLDGSLQPEWPPEVYPRLAALGRRCVDHDPSIRPSFEFIARVSAGSLGVPWMVTVSRGRVAARC